MFVRLARSLLLVLAAVALDGCGTSSDTPPLEASGSVTTVTAAEDAGAEEALDDPVELILVVSNQSYDKDEVAITVHVDDEEVVSEVFVGKGGHIWKAFHLPLAAGVHELFARSEDGTTHRLALNLPDGTSYANLYYWSGGDLGSHFTSSVSDMQSGGG